MKGGRQTERLRLQLAQEAAKIMAEQMVRDYQQAKQKACERLGYTGKQALPGNDEIHAALQSYLQLFKGEKHFDLIDELRTVAYDAMRFLNDFQPRLVGSVLNGTADKYSAVHLHLFADNKEDVLRFLIENNVDYYLTDVVVNFGPQRLQQIPRCHFLAGDQPIELSIFDINGLREAPRSPIDGKPMQRADLATVQRLLHNNKIDAHV